MPCTACFIVTRDPAYACHQRDAQLFGPISQERHMGMLDRRITGFRSGASKARFLHFLATQTRLDFAWHIEDDATLYNASWASLDQSFAHDKSDLIAAPWPRDVGGWVERSCSVCHGVSNESAILKVGWPVARVSRRLAQALMSAPEVKGHHEVVVPTFCAQQSWCTLNLRGLPTGQLYSWTGTPYPSDTRRITGRIYHPHKCSRAPSPSQPGRLIQGITMNFKHMSFPDVSGVLLANQFPIKCSRYLLVYDDLTGAGLGWTAKMLMYLLAFATFDNRVLLEIPASKPRWCLHPPFTLNCYYRTWSNCSIPSSTDIREFSFAGRKTNGNVTKMSLSTFHKRGNEWYGAAKYVHRISSDAMSVLFRPKQEFELMATQVLRNCSFEPGSYWTVFLRDSPEKRVEMGGRRLPEFKKYVSRIPSNVTSILWQTSNPKLLHIAVNSQLPYRMCFTNNSRHEKDVWGGRNNSFTDESGITGVLNHILGRQGGGAILPRASQWSWFLSTGAPFQGIFI